jgi:hypothetical protein
LIGVGHRVGHSREGVTVTVTVVVTVTVKVAAAVRIWVRVGIRRARATPEGPAPAAAVVRVGVRPARVGVGVVVVEQPVFYNPTAASESPAKVGLKATVCLVRTVTNLLQSNRPLQKGVV